MMKALVISMLAAASTALPAASDDAVANLGRTLAAVQAYAKTQGDRLWPGYGEAPFGFLLIAADRETLLCQGDRPAGFIPDGVDPVLGCAREVRPRSGLPDDLLAAMGVFSERETIVMGTPQTTGRTPGEWVRTILHEHFHQYEATFPDYFTRTKGLGLQADAADSQWMLNYPFPYGDTKVATAYAAASISLADALAARGQPDFLPAFDRYLVARDTFRRAVTARDWRYLEFELWQEGTARWTEIALGAAYPDPQVRSASQDLLARSLAKLREPDLKAQGRELVYPVGAGEAMLMEACGMAWRARFPHELAMGPLLQLARNACHPTTA